MVGLLRTSSASQCPHGLVLLVIPSSYPVLTFSPSTRPSITFCWCSAVRSQLLVLISIDLLVERFSLQHARNLSKNWPAVAAMPISQTHIHRNTLRHFSCPAEEKESPQPSNSAPLRLSPFTLQPFFFPLPCPLRRIIQGLSNRISLLAHSLRECSPSLGEFLICLGPVERASPPPISFLRV